jgi:hypothetical protein
MFGGFTTDERRTSFGTSSRNASNYFSNTFWENFSNCNVIGHKQWLSATDHKVIYDHSN